MKLLTSQMAILRAAASGQEILIPTEFNYLRGYLIGYDAETITLLAAMKTDGENGSTRLVWNATVVPRTHLMIFTEGRLANEEESVQALHIALAGEDFMRNCKNRIVSRTPDFP